jgi:hypothetical protein
MPSIVQKYNLCTVEIWNFWYTYYIDNGVMFIKIMSMLHLEKTEARADAFTATITTYNTKGETCLALNWEHNSKFSVLREEQKPGQEKFRQYILALRWLPRRELGIFSFLWLFPIVKVDHSPPSNPSSCSRSLCGFPQPNAICIV